MEEVKCYLYWIHVKEHTDIFSQGYVGVSIKPEWRFYQHLRNALNPKEYKKYRTEFREAMANEEAIYEIVLCSTSAYCYEIEGKLRPTWKIGWNLAAGGSGGIGTHGLSGTKVKGSYYNMLTRAQETGATICDDWLLENDGILNFQKFYEGIGEGLQISTAGLDYISPSTVSLLTRAELVTKAKRNYEVDGELYTVKELGVKYNLKANTISSRMRDGWKLEEALGLEKRPKPVVLDSAGNEIVYYGKLNQSDFEFIKQSLECGVLIRQIAKTLNISESNLSRLIDKMGYSKGVIKIETFLGNEIILPNSSTNLEDYKNVKKLLLEGETMGSIAKELGVSPSTMSTICKNLEWNGVACE